MLEVRLFGTFAIQHDGKPVVLSSRAAQSLFAYLILSPETQHRREKLAGMFWPEVTEAKARTYLRHELWRIRKAISAHTKNEYLTANEISISFISPGDVWLDVNALKIIGDEPTVEELTGALSVYRGEFLPGFYEQWVSDEREHLQSLFDQKVSQLLELLKNKKRWQEIIEWAERWLTLSQEPETAYRYMMIAYAAKGDQARVASTYERCRQALQALGLEPSEETRALLVKRTPRLNIPIPLSSFIGRERELVEIRSLLTNSRLLTLTGSGGVGKTRLAIQVVGDVFDQYPDGIWFLDLAPLNNAEFLPNKLANLLGLLESGDPKLSAGDLLRLYFRLSHVLLIFDNCEHLITSCAELANLLLTSCANLSILATSREALRISGERTYRVPSLDVPLIHNESTFATLANTSSVRLFVERAISTSPGFAIDTQNALTIAQICKRLDGIPLAIELAAARTNMLTVQEILSRLNDRFKLLTGGARTALPRHQTLRAMIEWSYDLLSEKERLLFKRLAVFSGGWTLEAADEVCSENGIDSTEVVDILSKLVNKSLVLVETVDRETRYRRLETIRQFAREKFLEDSESARLRDRHLIYFLKKAEDIEPHLVGTKQSLWMDYLDLELDNFRLALEWSVSNNKGEESFRLFSALGWFWFIRCHFTEGEEWFKKIIDLRTTVSKSTQAKALSWAAWLYMAKGDDPASTSCLQESLILYRELGDMKEVSTTLQLLGVNEFRGGFLVEARSYFEESLYISRQVNNKAAMPRVLIHLGQYSEIEGNFSGAWRYYEEALALCREIGEGHLTHVVLSTMGHFAFSQKDILKAREYYKGALEISLKLKNKRTSSETFLSFAEILNAEGRYSESAKLQGFAENLFEEAEALTESHVADIRRISEIPRRHLGEDSYRRAFDSGKSLSVEQAVAIATSSSN